MKRWAICKMGDYEGDGARVPKLVLHEANINVVAAKPDSDWAVVKFAARVMGPIQNDPDILVMPDIPMDLTLQGMTTAARNKLAGDITRIGFAVPSNSQNENMRGFMSALAHQLVPGVNIENGDVQDLE